MISVFEHDEASAPITPLARELAAIATEAQQINRILDCAEFLAWQDDGEGGRFQLWYLTKPIPGHPVGSTVSRQTLDQHLFGT
jgi:hypothetical protein